MATPEDPQVVLVSGTSSAGVKLPEGPKPSLNTTRTHQAQAYNPPGQRVSVSDKTWIWIYLIWCLVSVVYVRYVNVLIQIDVGSFGLPEKLSRSD